MPPRAALVFGANGQDGSYLIELLRAKGIEAVGVSRTGSWRRGDVADRAFVEHTISTLRPDYIFHLAARSTTRHDALFENHDTISTGTLNVLESARRHCPEARVFITGSGVQFRNTGDPIDEQSPFEASSPYAVARIQSVYAARYYRSLGLRTYVGYLFHHESPRRPDGHVSRMIATAARRIADGSQETVTIGDVAVVKEWTFAGDTMRAVLTLVDQDAVSEAMIGSGEGHSIEEWLECCFTEVGLPWRAHVTLVPNFRPEYERLISRPGLLKSLGWAPEVTFAQLAKMMVAAR